MNEALLCDILCHSLLASPFWSNYRPIPSLYADIPSFYYEIFPLYSAIGCLCSWTLISHTVHNWGGGGFTRVSENCLWIFAQNCSGTHFIVLTRGTMPGPILSLDPAGNGKSISADHAWIWTCEQNWYPTVNPSSQVQNGFIHFHCYFLTQICKYNQGIAP